MQTKFYKPERRLYISMRRNGTDEYEDSVFVTGSHDHTATNKKISEVTFSVCVCGRILG